MKQDSLEHFWSANSLAVYVLLGANTSTLLFRPVSLPHVARNGLDVTESQSRKHSRFVMSSGSLLSSGSARKEPSDRSSYLGFEHLKH